MSVLFARNSDEYVCRKVCHPMRCVIPTVGSSWQYHPSHGALAPIRSFRTRRWAGEYPIFRLVVFCVITPLLESFPLGVSRGEPVSEMPRSCRDQRLGTRWSV